MGWMGDIDGLGSRVNKIETRRADKKQLFSVFRFETTIQVWIFFRRTHTLSQIKANKRYNTRVVAISCRFQFQFSSFFYDFGELRFHTTTFAHLNG
jgi:hypothetical protein